MQQMNISDTDKSGINHVGSPSPLRGLRGEHVRLKPHLQLRITTNHIAGYEANGRFLQETAIEPTSKTLSALPTRDAIIVILSLLAMAKQQGKKISELTGSLPTRFTASNRLKEFSTNTAKECITQLIGNNDASAHQGDFWRNLWKS